MRPRSVQKDLVVLQEISGPFHGHSFYAVSRGFTGVLEVFHWTSGGVQRRSRSFWCIPLGFRDVLECCNMFYRVLRAQGLSRGSGAFLGASGCPGGLRGPKGVPWGFREVQRRSIELQKRSRCSQGVSGTFHGVVKGLAVLHLSAITYTETQFNSKVSNASELELQRQVQ